MMAARKRRQGAHGGGIAEAACTCWQGNQRATICMTCLRWRRLHTHLQAMRESLRRPMSGGF